MNYSEQTNGKKNKIYYLSPDKLVNTKNKNKNYYSREYAEQLFREKVQNTISLCTLITNIIIIILVFIMISEISYLKEVITNLGYLLNFN